MEMKQQPPRETDDEVSHNKQGNRELTIRVKSSRQRRHAPISLFQAASFSRFRRGFPQHLVHPIHLLDFSVCWSCYFVRGCFRGLGGGEEVVLDAADRLVVVWLGSGMERVRNCCSNACIAALSPSKVSRIRLNCSGEYSNSSLELIGLGLPGVSSIVWSSPLSGCKFSIADRITYSRSSTFQCCILVAHMSIAANRSCDQWN
jgi:hypothetical protein